MQNDLLVCDCLIIPKNHILYIKFDSKGSKYDIKVCDNDGKFIEWLSISPELFEEIKEQLTAEKKYQKKIKKLEEKVKELELHISLSPGGSEYFKTQEHYNNLEKNELGKE